MKHLTHNQTNILKDVDKLIHDQYSQESSGHDYDHIKRVVNLTTRLLIEEANPFVTYLIAYFHEVLDDKLESKYDTLESLLASYDLDLEGYELEVIKGIESIGFKGGFTSTDKSIEAQIVSDADTLDAMGAIGIGRAFYYAGSKGLPFHQEELVGVTADNYEEYRNKKRNIMTHFDEKLLILKDYLYTIKGKEIGLGRHKTLLEFYKSFHNELA
ncbi:MAG: phosphohydrolase [Erysipelothrix sp.]|nr:phosphohydrolase [Erysipelothrix sp.]